MYLGLIGVDFGNISTNGGMSGHNDCYPANFPINICRKRINQAVIVAISMIVFRVEMARKHSVVRQHDIDVFKFISGLRKTEFGVEEIGIDRGAI